MELLRIIAEDAEEAAEGLLSFRDAVPGKNEQITELGVALYAISSKLKGLDSLIRDPRYSPNIQRIENDLYRVQQSLRYSLDTLMDYFGYIDASEPKSRRVAYPRILTQLSESFLKEDRGHMGICLETYKSLLRSQELVMQGYV